MDACRRARCSACSGLGLLSPIHRLYPALRADLLPEAEARFARLRAYHDERHASGKTSEVVSDEDLARTVVDWVLCEEQVRQANAGKAEKKVRRKRGV